MIWELSHSYSDLVRPLADRHYNRQKPGSPRFVPPGRCKVFRAMIDGECRAFWSTSWPFAEYVMHEWAGAWICSAFRNEGAGLSSDLIRDAIAATRFFWSPPEIGMVTFVDPTKVRRKRDPGRCFIKAGFRHVGETKVHGLLAFQILPDEMPESQAPIGAQSRLFA